MTDDQQQVPAQETPGARTPPPQTPARTMTQAEERNWAMAAHLSALIAFISLPSLIGPLVVWLIKKDESEFVAAHGRDALNFNISVLIYTIVGTVALAVFGLATLGIGLFLAIPAVIVAFILWLVFVIQGAMAASKGNESKYPWTINFVS